LISLSHRVSLLRDAVQTAAGAQRPLDRRPQPAELVAGKTLFVTLFQQKRHPQQQLQDAAQRQPGVQEILQGTFIVNYASGSRLL
jgi:inosine-uridine nucleoside N-ribohydrolase